jgi:hypothetical protein
MPTATALSLLFVIVARHLIGSRSLRQLILLVKLPLRRLFQGLGEM